MNVKNLMIKPALFAVYAALMFSFIGCAVNPMEMVPDPIRDESWTAVSTFPSGVRTKFQSVVLTNGDVLVMGGTASSSKYFNDVWLSSNGGRNWNEITNQTPWQVRANFQTVLLPNNDILVMGGFSNVFIDYSQLNDIWLSKDNGRNWSQIPASGHWSARHGFQAVVLTNGDILVMGGQLFGGNMSTGVYLSKNGATNWSLIASSNHWSARCNFQAVVLANNDILVIGGQTTRVGDSLNDIWRSSDGGTNWSEITNSAPWANRFGFQTVLLNNGEILIMGGTGLVTILGRVRSYRFSGVWSSSDNGNSWNLIPRPSNETQYVPSRYHFQALVLENNEVLIMGGQLGNSLRNFLEDVWMRQF